MQFKGGRPEVVVSRAGIQHRLCLPKRMPATKCLNVSPHKFARSSLD
jgi:hypothetical protein